MRDPFLKRLELLLRKEIILLLKFLFSNKKKSFKKPDDLNSPKILFIRQDRIGDVLVSTPIFMPIKKRYPDSILDIVLSKNNYFVLQNENLIRKKWLYQKNLIKLLKMIFAIRKENYDFAVDLSDNVSVTSSILSILAGAKYKVGLEKENSFIYNISVPLLSRKEIHIVERIAQLLLAFGIDPKQENLRLRYFTSADSDLKVENFLNEFNLSGKFIIGINISAGTDARFWGIDNFVKLINWITSKYEDFCTFVLYKPSDLARAGDICKSTSAILSPITESFDLFAAFIKRTKLLVSPDTAAIHLAAAFNIPCVALYVQSNKSLRIWEPYNVDCEVLVTDVDDLSTIEPEEVIKAVDKIINRIINKIIS